MRSARGVALTVVASLALLPASASAATCLRIGVYQDDPARDLPVLTKAAGPGVGVISTYLTAGKPLNPALVTFANAKRAGLLVNWMPDGGRDGARQPRFRVSAVSAGRYDRSLRTLARQLRTVRGPVVLRPMPEPNTTWYAWSGTVNGNTPKGYVKAWNRVRRVVRSAGGTKIKLLWSPYARSVPDSGANAIPAYFPGRTQVDLVGASAYNFGSRGSLLWTEPAGLFSGAYATIQALARKPFWISETGSGMRGGDKAAWILSLSRLQSTMPRLAGIVYYDVSEPNGDFRLRGKAVGSAFKALLRRRCR
jgi:hypothetical protein